MVGVAAYFDYCAVKLITDATEVGVKCCFYGWVYQRLPVLGAECDVHIIFRATHIGNILCKVTKPIP